MIPRNEIRLAIRELESIQDIQAMINLCFTMHTERDDKLFIQECASEIYWREKEDE